MRGDLRHGDNLVSLRSLAVGSVDVVYTDPPFGSGRDYATTLASFGDSWRWDAGAETALADEPPGPVGDMLRPMVEILRRSEVAAYLVWMLPRLREIRRVVKRRGAIWLHCDDHASHYLGPLMQALHVERFGRPMYSIPVVWKRSSGANHGTRKGFTRCHDTLIYLGPGSRGPAGNACWDDISPLNHRDKARIGYPTEKPVALISRTLAYSATPGGLFLDPFCGSGSSLLAAERHGLRWIGMDASEGAIAAVRKRLGAPETQPATRDLFEGVAA